MVKKFKILVYFFFVVCCAPKISEAQLYSDFENYSHHLCRKEYEKVISYMPTVFWKKYQKAQILEGLSKADKQTGGFELKNLKIIETSKTLKSKDNYFKVLSYSSDIIFKYSNLTPLFIEKQFKNYGKENVKVDSISGYMTIKGVRKMVAVYDKGLKQWKYLEANPQIITTVYGLETTIDLLNYIEQ